MKEIILFLIIIAIKCSLFSAVNTDKQTVIKFEGRIDSNLTIGSITKWTPWSKCEACRQHRRKFNLLSNTAIGKIEEKPCRRMHCLRQWQKKRSRRRMRIIPTQHLNRARATKQLPSNYTKINNYLIPIGTESKQRIWSKWSTWSKCSKSCHTHRYKVCRKPGRCRKSKKYESALCYVPATQCEAHVNQILRDYETFTPTMHPVVTSTTTTTTTRRPDVQHSSKRNKKPQKNRLKRFCGRPLRKHSMLKIKGGKDANRSLWPWHVAIVNERNEVFCSGTLIAPRWVLTAAHCVRTQLKVRINEFDLRQPDGEIEIPVIWSRRHHRFNEKNIDNDIGLLYMQRGVKTPVACLPSQQPVEKDLCTVLGWGALNAFTELAGYPILQEAKLPIVNRSTCKNAYQDYYLSKNMFCAGYSSGMIDTCAGDSGGGLMCRTLRPQNGKKTVAYTAQGITSFGDACGKQFRYGIYTNVANYIDWINHTMIEDSKLFKNNRRKLYRRQYHF